MGKSGRFRFSSQLKAGNIVSKYVSYADADNYTKYTYVHDAWNRLVRIAFEEMVDGDGLTPIDVADYRYNGLTWRVTKKADTSLPTVDGIDEMHVYIYSAGWQLLEDRIDAGWGGSGFTADKIQQVIYGIRYIDDVVCRRLDGNADGDYTDSSDGDKTYYHLTDQQFSTVAIVDENAALLERVSYDAYGRARHHRRCDFTGDGATNNSDLGAVIANWGNSGVADSNRDGTVNSTDQLAVVGDWAAGETLGVLSPASAGVRGGWRGRRPGGKADSLQWPGPDDADVYFARVWVGCPLPARFAAAVPG